MTTPDPLYNPNVPQNASDALAISQPQFLDNFKFLYNSFAKNHVALDAGADAGNHTIIELPAQSKAFQTDVSEISMYSKSVENQGEEVFLRYQGNGQEFQYTAYQTYTLPDLSKQKQFFSFLPGKIIVYFGTITTDSEPSTLNLNPGIAKKIISVSTCAVGSTPTTKVGTKLIQSGSGFFRRIELFGVGSGQYFYMVMANT